MKIKFVEIQNFRKLKQSRIDFSTETTLFVGANNSGKTSAMEMLIKFLLKEPSRFTFNDFTISNGEIINEIGQSWTSDKNEEINLWEEKWEKVFPTLDVWIDVEEDEIHRVTHLIPTLDWTGTLLGVRLVLEPKNLEELYKGYLKSFSAAKKTMKHDIGDQKLVLWPRDLCEYLRRSLNKYFTIREYILDPDFIDQNVEKLPQRTPQGLEPLDVNGLKGLIKINTINAQRGFSDANCDAEQSRDNNKLSGQLKSYYDNHLNPEELPSKEDIGALRAIDQAQEIFNERLQEGFKLAIEELETLGYPGMANPKINIHTKINTVDGLNHDAAVQYFICKTGENEYRLPEKYNGLGYQNLISMVFKLMGFRDEWMQVGKVKKRKTEDNSAIPLLHLVFIEEPEAHLHAQVQQVFIRQAYSILRKHEKLGESQNFSTQLVVSTHSNNIAIETEFKNLRYFKRIPANNLSEAPTSRVINLSDVFGRDDGTSKFVTRYIKTTHCDLFFADAAILIEGSAERMMIPHFIRGEFPGLNQSYISLLEISGSHAHRLKPLIEKLGLTCLVITDLDAVNPDANNKSARPKKGENLTTGNNTLKSWVPMCQEIDELFALNEDEKVKTYSEYGGYKVKAAYQEPIRVMLEIGNEGKKTEGEIIPNTFEDALLYDNIDVFKKIEGFGLIKKFRNAVSHSKTIDEFSDKVFEILQEKNIKKAEFILEILYSQDPADIKTPTYIKEGLQWLEKEILGDNITEGANNATGYRI